MHLQDLQDPSPTTEVEVERVAWQSSSIYARRFGLPGSPGQHNDSDSDNGDRLEAWGTE